jgi:hypothetical protein
MIVKGGDSLRGLCEGEGERREWWRVKYIIYMYENSTMIHTKISERGGGIKKIMEMGS